MTAEVLIMNKEAVAMAADSAVTHREADSPKIFTSANKMFTLSKFHPVGVMIYGSSQFMGVPWETVIKEYRKALGEDRFSELSEYATDFLEFLEADTRFSPPSEQKAYFRTLCLSLFRYLRKTVEEEVQEVVDARGEITREEAVEIAKSKVRGARDSWLDREGPEAVSDEARAEFREAHEDVIDNLRRTVFENLLTSVLSRWLGELAVEMGLKYSPSEGAHRTSGVVIAGFGDDDIFPAYCAYTVGGIIHGKLKYSQFASSKIQHDREGVIMPFAQQEMVRTFVEGADPNYRSVTEQSLRKILLKLPRKIIDSIDQLSAEEKTEKKKSIRTVANRLLSEYQARMQTHRQRSYIDPLMSVVSVLPKDELAGVAESLVNITSFKRRVSLDEETVGGPIDVAIISRGDGFIWMQRKHYFDPELNPHFFENYFREVRDGNED